MTNRLIIGRHPLDGSYGLWLSLPGINAAATTASANFLISPVVKNDGVLIAGQVGSGVTVFFPEAFSSKPFVYFWPTNNAGVEFYPFPTNVATEFGECSVTVSGSSMVFNDTTGLGLIFNYFVANRALP